MHRGIPGLHGDLPDVLRKNVRQGRFQQYGPNMTPPQFRGDDEAAHVPCVVLPIQGHAAQKRPVLLHAPPLGAVFRRQRGQRPGDLLFRFKNLARQSHQPLRVGLPSTPDLHGSLPLRKDSLWLSPFPGYSTTAFLKFQTLVLLCCLQGAARSQVLP